MGTHDRIHLELPPEFDVDDVRDAINEDFVRKVHEAFANGAEEIAVTSKKESPPRA
jgi:hypothetical protein